jgi:hypothetical protein
MEGVSDLVPREIGKEGLQILVIEEYITTCHLRYPAKSGTSTLPTGRQA